MYSTLWFSVCSNKAVRKMQRICDNKTEQSDTVAPGAWLVLPPPWSTSEWCTVHCQNTVAAPVVWPRHQSYVLYTHRISQRPGKFCFGEERKVFFFFILHSFPFFPFLFLFNSLPMHEYAMAWLGSIPDGMSIHARCLLNNCLSAWPSIAVTKEVQPHKSRPKVTFYLQSLNSLIFCSKV